MWDWISGALGSVWDTAKSAVSSDLGKTLLSTGAGLLGNYLTSSSQADQTQQLANQTQQNYQNYIDQMNAYYDEYNEQQQENYEKYLKLLKPTESQKKAYSQSAKKSARADAASNAKTLTQNLASRNLGGGQVASGLADNSRALTSTLGDIDVKTELFGAGSNPNMLNTTQRQATLMPTLSSTSASDLFTSNLGNVLQYGSGLGLSSLLKNSNLFGDGNYGLTSNQINYGKDYFDWSGDLTGNQANYLKSYFNW